MSTFSKKVTSAIAGLAIVFSMFTPIAGVSAAYTSLQAANELAVLGFIVDNSANPADYRLGDTISREELSKVIANLGGLAVSNVESVYADADFASWAEKYAAALNGAGYAASNTYFNPKSNTSKIEALKWVMEAQDIATGQGSDWMAARVDGAVAAGITSSFSDYNTDVTRGQVFIWAAEALNVAQEEETSTVAEDPLCELLGICDDGSEEVAEEEMEDEEEATEEVAEEIAEQAAQIFGSSNAMVSLSPQSPSNGLAAVNTPRVAMLAFDVTAGSEDVTLEEATFLHVGLGDKDNVDDVTIYNSSNESVSKTKNFSDNDLDLSFDRDVVVQAGETQTFTVSATISDTGSTNTTYQIELVALEASTDVEGGGIIGAALTPTEVANSAKLEIDADTASDTVTIGEEVKLAGFSIEEKNDNEDVLVRSITLHQNGSVDAEYIEDLVLLADGKTIKRGMMVNSDDELVMNIDYVLEADEDVEFELHGVISGDVTEDVHFEFEGIDDVYATGLSTGFNVGFTDGNSPEDADVADPETIEGAEIDAVFDHSDIDDTKVDVSDVLVGTLELTANSNDYEVTKITVTVGGTAGTDAVDDLHLGGQSFDSNDGSDYVFEDIALAKGVTKVLPLEFDVVNDVDLNGKTVTFQVKVTEIEDDENNITYSDGGTNDVDDILSTNSFDDVSIDVQTASFELSQTSINDRELVLGNGVETVLYKGKVSTGDSDSVTIEDFSLTESGDATISVDLDDVIDSATLNIGGKTYDADIDADSVDFTSINHVVAAGSDNVELLVTAVLQDDDSVGDNETLIMQLISSNITLEDSDGEAVSTDNISGGKNTTTTLRGNGKFSIELLGADDTDDDLETTVLAGSNSVVLAQLEMEAEYEDADVKTLKFNIPSGASAGTVNVTVATTTENVSEAAGQTQVMQITVPSNLHSGGTLGIDVDGNAVSGSSLENFATAIASEAGIATAEVDGEEITVTAAVEGTGFTLNNPTFNGSQESSIEVSTVTPNQAGVDASGTVAAVKTITTDADLVDGHTIAATIDDTRITQAFDTDNDTTLAAFATAIAAVDSITTATVSGRVIEITAAEAGVDFTISNAIVTSSGGEDFSDTFSDVKIMSGSKTLASGGVVTYDGNNTVIKFEDFTVSDDDDLIEANLVADLAKYTTEGDEVTAQLGDVTISIDDATLDVEGADSDDTYSSADNNLTVAATTSETIKIVPVIVTVSNTDSLGENDEYATARFSVNFGSNELDDDDLYLSSVSAEALTASVDVRNDDDDTVTTTTDTGDNIITVDISTTANLALAKINNSDSFTFKVGAVDEELRVKKNGFTFFVDMNGNGSVDTGEEFTSTNENVIDFGEYYKD